MLSMFKRRPRKAAPVRRAPRAVSRLSLESLDGRDVPSAAPVISGFEAVQIGNGVYEISGTVTDADSSVDGLTITFSGGLPGIEGQTTVTVAGGSFSAILTVTDYSIGAIIATTVDPDGNVSNSPYEYVTPTPPPDQSGGGKGPGGGN